MRILMGAFLMACLAVSSVGPAGAKTIREVGSPAETPPESYQGKQYVDSRGCVFIRAGYGGQVTWVPRVNRKREVYCSKENKPSLSHSQLAALGSTPVIVKTEPVIKTPTSVAATTKSTTTVASAATKQTITKRKRRSVGASTRQDAQATALNRRAGTRHRVVQRNLTIAAVTVDPDVTAAGDAQMEKIWTNTVPRRLIVRRVGVKASN